MSNQTPLKESSFHLIYSTKRNQFLRDWGKEDSVGKWTDLIRMSWRFEYGTWSRDTKEQSDKLLKNYSEKFPDEELEVRSFQLQFVELT
jgi:hypothetical protein